MLKFILCLFLLSSPALADDACDIRIEFDSYGSGLDAKTYAAVMDKIIATPAVTGQYIQTLGPEGERTLCLTVAPDQIEMVYTNLKALIPAESKQTWTRISTRQGQEFVTQKSKDQ